jgi:hypothetical protein
VLSQGMAKLYNNSLKKDYAPLGEDAMLEAVVREVEKENGHFR